ncbi:MAG: glycosyltransferase family 2 protein [Thermodesulfobacteriota bacterium]|nr:glycosyltransferase family 2 protein [Thermodesulfobacteriota bacterium]
MKLPFVSIIIPCLNEEKYIGKCLSSIIANDYPKDKLEVLVVDGMSEDATREIVRETFERLNVGTCTWGREDCEDEKMGRWEGRGHVNIKLLDNPSHIVPAALNVGLRHAKGDIIMRMDAHTTYAKDYVSKCVKYMKADNADSVGGILGTTPGSNTVLSKSITMVLSSPFGVGNGYFRTGSIEPRYVDTVPFGCYKKEVFEKIGVFNENLIRNQDIEFNLRLKKAGGRILLFPDIVSYYHARPTLSALAKNNFSNGLWVIYSTRFARMPFSIRHLIPFFFVISQIMTFILSLFYLPFLYLFASIIGLYLITNIFFSLKLSLKNRIKYFPYLILSFFTLHYSYGAGSLWGVFRLIQPKK